MQTLRIAFTLFICSITFQYSIGQVDNRKIQFDTLLSQANSAGDSTALELAYKAFDVAVELDSINLQIKALEFVDNYHYKRYEFQETADNLKRLIGLHRINGNEKKIGQLCVYLCLPLRNLSNYDSLYKYYEMGLEIAIRNGYKAMEGELYLQMSDYYNMGMNDFETAIVYLKKSLPILIEEGDRKQIGLSRVYHDLGKNYNTLMMIDSAQKYVDLSVKVANKIGKPSIIEVTTASKAEFLEGIGKHKEAIPFAKKALELSKEIGYKTAIIFNAVNLANINMKLDNYSPEVLDYINLAIKEGEQDSLNRKLMDAYSSKTKYYKGVKRFDLALEAYTTETALRSKLADHLAKQDLKSLEYERDIATKKSELAIVKSQNKANRRLVYMLGALGLLLLFTGVSLWNRSKLKYRLNQKENERLKAEKERDEAALEKLKSEKEVEKEKTERLKEKLDSNQRELAYTALFISKKNELLSKIKEEVSKSESDNQNSKDRLISVQNMVERNLDDEDDWNVFKDRFESVHPNFYKALDSKYPNLTSNELKLLSYLKMNMDTIEIAKLAGVNPTSVHKARYRLRKKLNLEEEFSLESFVKSI